MLIRTPGSSAFVLVSDQTSLPRFWATVWVSGLHGASFSAGTKKAQLRHIGAFYEACDRGYGADALDAAFSEGRVDAVEAMLADFYLTVASVTSRNSGVVARWDAVRNFAKAVALMLSPRNSAWKSVPAFLEGLGKIRRQDHGKFKYVRALPASTLDDLLEVAHPHGQRNPFEDDRVRWRNWLIVHLLLLGGLRRGEALLLVVDSLKHDVDRHTGQVKYWLDVTTTEDEDDRATRPSIKTAESHRQIPVSEDLAELYQHYVSDARFSEGDVPFLLTSSRGGLPLSAESVNKMFESFTAALAPQAYQRFHELTGGKRHVSPHDLRHTSATVRYATFLAKDKDRELALQRMRAFFGWSVTSEMPDLYARSAIQDDLLRSWDDLFDQRVLQLRRRSA